MVVMGVVSQKFRRSAASVTVILVERVILNKACLVQGDEVLVVERWPNHDYEREHLSPVHESRFSHQCFSSAEIQASSHHGDCSHVLTPFHVIEHVL